MNKQHIRSHFNAFIGQILDRIPANDRRTSFRVIGMQPELWDPLSGTTCLLPAFEQGTNTITVPLQLSANGSAFIVFQQKGNPSAQNIYANFPEPTIVTTVNGPWTVSFEHDAIKRGPSQPIVFNELKDWTKMEDGRIRYYSGTAVYTTSFSVNEFSQKKKILSRSW